MTTECCANALGGQYPQRSIVDTLLDVWAGVQLLQLEKSEFSFGRQFELSGYCQAAERICVLRVREHA